MERGARRTSVLHPSSPLPLFRRTRLRHDGRCEHGEHEEEAQNQLAQRCQTDHSGKGEAERVGARGRPRERKEFSFVCFSRPASLSSHQKAGQRPPFAQLPPCPNRAHTRDWWSLHTAPCTRRGRRRPEEHARARATRVSSSRRSSPKKTDATAGSRVCSHSHTQHAYTQ